MKIGVYAHGGIGNWILASPMLQALEIMGHEVELLIDSRDDRNVQLKEISWLPVLEFLELSPAELEKKYSLLIAYRHPGDIPGFVRYTLSEEVRNSLVFPLVRWLREERHEIEYFMRSARMLGWKGPPPLPWVPIAPHKEASAPHIGFAVGVVKSPQWFKKAWPWQRWSDLAQFLYPEKIMVYGGLSDSPISSRIARGAAANVTIMLGRPLKEVSGLLRTSCKLLIGNDTGISHLAVAVGVPAVVLYGPTRLRKNEQIGRNRVMTVESPSRCTPCYATREWDRCPGGCMQEISVGHVKRLITKHFPL